MDKIRDLLRRDRGPRSWATRSSRRAPAASASSRADVALQYGLSGANAAGQRASTGTSAATHRVGLAYDKVDWKVWTHPDGDSLRPLLGAPAGDPRGDQDRRPALDGLPARPDHGQGARASSRCPRARPGSPPRTRSARWATTSSPRATSVPFRVKIRSRQRSTTSRSRRGCCAACTSPTSSRSWRQPLLHPRGHRPMNVLASIDSPYWQQTLIKRRASSAVVVPMLGRHARLPSSCSRSCQLHAEPARARWRPGPTARCSCSPRSASSCRRKTSSPTSADRLRLQAGARSSCCRRRSCSFVVIPAGPDAVVARPRHRHLLRAGGVVALGHRHPHGRLGVGQQVLAHRRPARRRPAHRLRAADGARRRRRGHPGRHAEPAGHRRPPSPTARSSASAASATRSSSPSSSASSSS